MASEEQYSKWLEKVRDIEARAAVGDKTWRIELWALYYDMEVIENVENALDTVHSERIT